MQVFISYSRHDSAFVSQVVAFLEKSGHDVWLDASDIRGSEEWRESVVTAIRSAEVVILVVSPRSMASEDVEREITVAAEEHRRIVPVLLERAELAGGIRYELAGVQYVSFVGAAFEDAATELLDAMDPARVSGTQRRSRTPAALPTRLKASIGSPRHVAGGLIVLAVAVAGVVIAVALFPGGSRPAAPVVTASPDTFAARPPTVTASPTVTSSPTVTPSPTPSHENAVAPLVAITSVSLLTGAKKVIYEISGTQIGVTDPPWLIYVVAKPGSGKGGGWWVSRKVVPDAQGTWRARLVANARPRSPTEVTFQPLLVRSPEAEPTPVPVLTTPEPGQSPTPPAVSTVASIKDVLAQEGPRSDVVGKAFATFALPVSP